MTASLTPARPTTPTATVPTRRSPWPYAALVSAVTSGAATFFLAIGSGAYQGEPSPMTTQYLHDNLSGAGEVMLGGALALVALIASMVFLIGLTRLHARLAPHRDGLLEALRWSGIAFVGIGVLGVVMRYVAAGGVPGGIDESFYSPEASSVLAVLADQLMFGVYLPGLAVMVVVGLLAIRDRVLPLGVGIVGLVLATGSTAATLVLGLPYSSGLVWPIFALVVGATGMFLRR